MAGGMGAALGPHWGPGATPGRGFRGAKPPERKWVLRQYLTENLALLTHRIYLFYFINFIKCDKNFSKFYYLLNFKY